MIDVDERAASGPSRGRLVLVHGSMDTHRSFRRLRDALPEWDTVAYDRRGYGAALDPDAPPASIERHAQDLEDVLTEPSVLLGHSLGAVLSLMAASRRPDLVRAVVVYEPPLPWLPEWPDAPLARSDDPELVRESGERFVRHAMGEGAWERLTPRQQARFHDWSPALERELGELTFRPADPALEWPFDPTAVAAPVLVLHGERTAARHQWGAGEWRRRLPDAEVGTIAEAAHTGHVSQPERVAAAARDFLGRRLG